MISLSNTQFYTMQKLFEGYSLTLEVVGEIKRGVLKKKGEVLEDVPYKTVMWLVEWKFIAKKGKFFYPLVKKEDVVSHVRRSAQPSRDVKGDSFIERLLS